MKQKLLLLLAIASLFSCKSTTVDHHMSLTLSESTMSLQFPQSKQITITGPDKYVTDPNIRWVSSDPSIAMVSNTGLVSSLSPGKATIFAFVKGLNAVRGECQVTVSGKLDAEIEITAPSSTVNAGDTLYIQYAYTPNIDELSSQINIIQSDTVGRKIAETSFALDENKQIIEGKLQIKALSPGQVMIKLENKYDKTVRDSIILTINSVEMTSYAFSTPTPFELEAGQSDKIKIEILPKAAQYRTISWRSADPSLIAVGSTTSSVGKDGTIDVALTALKSAGSTKIYASTDDGQVITCDVTIVPSTTEKIKFGKKTVNIRLNATSPESTPLDITVSPSSSTSYTLRLDESYNPEQGQRTTVAFSSSKKAIITDYTSTQTGSARIIAQTQTKDGKTIADSCIINIEDVSDNLFSCKPKYSAIDLGTKVLITAHIANFTATDATLDRVELICKTVETVENPATGKDEKIETTKSIQTLSSLGILVNGINGTNENFKKAIFTPIDSKIFKSYDPKKIKTHLVKYTYTIGNQVINIVSRIVEEDNGAVFSARR